MERLFYQGTMEQRQSFKKEICVHLIIAFIFYFAIALGIDKFGFEYIVKANYLFFNFILKGTILINTTFITSALFVISIHLSLIYYIFWKLVIVNLYKKHYFISFGIPKDQLFMSIIRDGIFCLKS